MTIPSKKLPIGLFEDQTDIGPVRHAGACVYDAEQQSYAMAGAGANIWGERDSFHYIWKRMRGNFIVTARAAWIGAGTNPHRKLGWMARTGLEPGSPHVSAVLHGDGLDSLQFRRTPDGPTEEARAQRTGADIVQLERKGNAFSMSVARYGDPFTVVQVADIGLGEDVYLGLFVCSHEEEIVERAAVRDVRIVSPVKPDFDRGRDPFGSHLELLDLASGRRRIIHSSDGVLEAPNWTRDGRALIYNNGGRLYRFDLAAGTSALIDTGDVIQNNNDHVISFDGRMLAISSHDGEDNLSRVYTVPLEGGQPRLVTPAGPSYLHGWSPDGAFLVYTAFRDGDYDIYRIPAGGGAETRLTTAIGLDDGPEYTPDGRYIYFNSVRSGSMQIWRMRPDGGGQEQMTDDECNNWFPHISPDGQWVVFVSYLPGEVDPGDHPPAKRVYLRRMPLDGGEPRVLAYLYGGQGTMNVPSWSPDSNQLAFVSNTVPYQEARPTAALSLKE
jgi:TolB protein